MEMMFFSSEKNQKRILARVSVSETRPCEKAENEWLLSGRIIKRMKACELPIIQENFSYYVGGIRICKVI